MMSKKQTIKSKRIVAIILILLNVVVCFTQEVVVKRSLKAEYFPNGYGKNGMLFNDDGSVNFYELDTAYQANMTLLIEKKTMHSYIIVDIEKANLKKNITEKQLVKSPYCYYTIATTGEIYCSMFYFSSIPMAIHVGKDTVYEFDYYKSSIFVYSQDWRLYEPQVFWKKGDYEGQFNNFYVVPFNKPVHKAVLCLIKAKLIKQYAGILSFTSYANLRQEDIPKYSTLRTCDEYISPYKFDNDEAFYKVLFPYADPKPYTTQVK